MTVADGHADTDRTDAHADFFRTRRHGETDSSRRNCHYCKTLDHCLLLDV
jgi:hypothetical protein